MKVRSLGAETVAQVAPGETRILKLACWFAQILKVTSADLVPAGHSSIPF